MLRMVYPGRQVECNKSSQHKLDYKMKRVNDEKRETKKEEENITQNDKKTKREAQECDFKIHEHNSNDTEHELNKEDTEIEKEKNAEPKNNKENYPNQR